MIEYPFNSGLTNYHIATSFVRAYLTRHSTKYLSTLLQPCDYLTCFARDKVPVYRFQCPLESNINELNKAISKRLPTKRETLREIYDTAMFIPMWIDYFVNKEMCDLTFDSHIQRKTQYLFDSSELREYAIKQLVRRELWFSHLYELKGKASKVAAKALELAPKKKIVEYVVDWDG